MNRFIKYLLLSCLVISSTGLFAQSSAIDRYYENYLEDERFTQVTVSSKMFSLFVNFERDDPAEQELINTISKLKGLKILVGDDMEGISSTYKKAISKPSSMMEELMSIRDTGQEFKFYVTESGGTISELLMVGHEDDSLIIMSLVGDINLAEIAALSKKMNIDGFEHFEKIEKK